MPELTPTAYFVPIKLANFFSKIPNSLPRVKSPDCITFFTLFKIWSIFLNCCGKYEYLTFEFFIIKRDL